MTGDGRWITRLHRRVRGVTVLGPKEDPARHPAPGQWAVVGPTGEFSFSPTSADHAAMLFLAHYCGDMDAAARAAAGDSAPMDES